MIKDVVVNLSAGTAGADVAGDYAPKARTPPTP